MAGDLQSSSHTSTWVPLAGPGVYVGQLPVVMDALKLDTFCPMGLSCVLSAVSWSGNRSPRNPDHLLCPVVLAQLATKCCSNLRS